MEIRQMKPEEYSLVLENLNHVFGKAGNKIVDFTRLLPKIFDGSGECARRHYGAFDGENLASLVGVYLMPVVIGGKRFQFATVGNMITRPEYEGLGLMSQVFAYGMEKARQLGAQAVRLGGARHRYERFDVTPAGSSHHFVISPKCVKYHPPGCTIGFTLIEEEDLEAIRFARQVYETSSFYVDRGDEQGFFRSLCNYSGKAYLAYRMETGEKLGYVLAGQNESQVIECHAVEPEAFWDLLASWQKRLGSDITIDLPAAEVALCRMLAYRAESFSVAPASSFAVFDYVALSCSLLELKARHTCLPAGKLVLDIAGYGRFCLAYDGKQATAELTQEAADVSLSQIEATRFLFGPLPPEFTAPNTQALANAWLPLPLSWCNQDRG